MADSSIATESLGRRWNGSCQIFRVPTTALWCLLVLLTETQTAKAFVPMGRKAGSIPEQRPAASRKSSPITPGVILFASKKKGGKKKKTKPKQGGGGFGGGGKASAEASSGGGGASSPSVKPVRADKNSLESQWDAFASITDLEIKPLGDPTDEDYEHFEVADVFVRSGGGGENDDKNDDDKSTGWFRIGKVCVSGTETTLEAAMALQKGLIFWTAVHMRRELMALGKASATSLELGYVVPASLCMGSETDGPWGEDDDEDEEQQQQSALTVFGATPELSELLEKVEDKRSFGFRPDWNPPGFTYKRRESAARKDKAKKGAGSRLGDALVGSD